MVTTGQSVGHYDILEKLGEGGMGVVYKARDRSLDRIVALKLLRSDRLTGKDWQRRLAAEARAASGLNHPNIVTIYELFSEGDAHFIAMEWVQGTTLDQLIPPKGMRLSTALKIAIQIADALSAAAAVGIVHRDIKPSNIMVTESGLVKVLDFGLAKVTQVGEGDEKEPYSERTVALTTEAEVRTKPGTVLGTGPYMSPEQAEGKALDPRSDIFSFGSLLYEMFTGERAFRGQSIISIVTSILRDDPPSPSQITRDLPYDLDKTILRCLRKDPERRFQSMADVRIALLELKEDAESGQLLPSGKKRRRVATVWIAAAALIVAGISIATWFVTRHARPELHTEAIPFSNSPGFQGYPSFSPDGRQIAFAWTGGKGTTTHIFVKVIGTESALRLTSSEYSDSHPAWAPDGRSIAFLRALSPTKTAVYEVPPLGGSERELSTFGTALFPGLTWTGNTNWLLTSGYPAGRTEQKRILAVSHSTGELRVLALAGPGDEFSPAVSPDSHQLAFSKQVAEWNWQLYVVPIGDELQPIGKPRHVMAPAGTNRQTVWTTDGNELIFANGGSVNTQLWRTPIDNSKPPRLVLPGEAVGYQPAIAPLGKQLAYVHDFNNASIWSVSVTADGKAGTPVQTISSARSSWILPNAFSPDGRRITFESTRSGQRAIWTSDTDGSNPALVFGEPGYSSGSPVWSPDGRWIAFDARLRGKGDIFVAPTAGGGVRRVTNADDDDLVPCWSHDGQWIYYSSIRSGRAQVYKMSPAGGKEIRVTVNGGWGPQESPDGKYLYYTRARATDTQLWRMPVEGGPEQMILPSVRERRWAATNVGVWYMKTADPGERDRWMMESAGSADGTVEFLRFPRHDILSSGLVVKDPVSGLAVSPDGSTLLFSKLDHRASEIVLLENFQ